MTRALASRFLASFLALTSGFAVPITAVAHGYDHHSEPVAGTHQHGDVPHDDHHSGSPEHAVGHALIAPGAAALDEAAHEGSVSHSHPCLDRARSSRIECPAFALVTLQIPVAIEQRRTAVPPPDVDTGSRPRALTHAPPPPPRAPPGTPG